MCSMSDLKPRVSIYSISDVEALGYLRAVTSFLQALKEARTTLPLRG